MMSMASLAMAGHAQLNTRGLHGAFDDFRKELHNDYEGFRQEATSQFIEFVRDKWKEFEAVEPVRKPVEKEIPPVVIPEEEKSKPIEDKPIVVEDTIKVIPEEPQPQPIEPVEEIPVIDDAYYTFSFYGSSLKVRYDRTQVFKLEKLRENDVANALKVLANESNDNLIYDCLAIRKNLQLCDWAYLMMLNILSNELCGADTNEATLLCAYLYAQSGYQMRLAMDDTRLYMLYASRHVIFNKTGYQLQGVCYYCLGELPSKMRVCEVSFPNEKSLSLQITQNQKFVDEPSTSRTTRSRDFPEIQVTTSVNKNAIDFYSTYPASYYNQNFMTRWAINANTPLPESIKTSIYPTIQALVTGKSQFDAVNRVLNWVQTGFEYEYDDKIWGGDRSFFAEETLYYPYCDCEDRSILFSRVVRDLFGLDVMLIYYPGHLATAVGFTEDVQGDYIMHEGKKYVVCDPTYIGASVGRSMPDLDNTKVKVILLK